MRSSGRSYASETGRARFRYCRCSQRARPGSTGSISVLGIPESRPTTPLAPARTARIAGDLRSPRSHTARLRRAAVGRVRREVCAKLARWNRGSMSTSGSAFRDLRIHESAGRSIPYFIPSMGATVGDGRKRSATGTPGSGPVRDCQGRSETALKRLLIRRFWVRNPGGAPRSSRSEALKRRTEKVYRAS